MDHHVHRTMALQLLHSIQPSMFRLHCSSCRFGAILGWTNSIRIHIAPEFLRLQGGCWDWSLHQIIWKYALKESTFYPVSCMSDALMEFFASPLRFNVDITALARDKKKWEGECKKINFYFLGNFKHFVMYAIIITLWNIQSVADNDLNTDSNWAMQHWSPPVTCSRYLYWTPLNALHNCTECNTPNWTPSRYKSALHNNFGNCEDLFLEWYVYGNSIPNTISFSKSHGTLSSLSQGEGWVNCPKHMCVQLMTQTKYDDSPLTWV